MYKTEKVWHYNKYICAVVALDLGHRCGYVGVNKDSKLFGISYDDDLNKYYNISEKDFPNNESKENFSLDIIINVHGGITYSSNNSNYYPIYTEKDIWFFGFDCAHCGDAKDTKLMCKYKINFYKDNNISLGCSGDTIRTLDYCIDECNSMAKQMESVEKMLISK